MKKNKRNTPKTKSGSKADQAIIDAETKPPKKIDHRDVAPPPPSSPKALDPAKPMWHLVTPALQREIVAILKTLPYERVAGVMPALVSAPLHQD